MTPRPGSAFGSGLPELAAVVALCRVPSLEKGNTEPSPFYFIFKASSKFKFTT